MKYQNNIKNKKVDPTLKKSMSKLKGPVTIERLGTSLKNGSLKKKTWSLLKSGVTLEKVSNWADSFSFFEK